MHIIVNPLTPILATALSLSLSSITVLAFAETEIEPEAESRLCTVDFDAEASYPPLPPPVGADLGDEAQVLLHLLYGRGVIELDGCLYEVDRPLLADFDRFTQIDILFEFDEESADPSATPQLFVTGNHGLEVYHGEAGQLTYVLEVADLGSSELGFEFALPGQQAPVSPVIRVEPITGNPEPK